MASRGELASGISGAASRSDLAMRRRGHLRVFLGMAAGVRKTFRMLLEGHAEQKAGRHVVIGLLETHGRADTAKLAVGLPLLPRRRLDDRGAVLESLNDQIAELSGIRVRETIPDGVLGRADEIVMVDLTPEALLERLRAGKVYPAERIDAALNNFFRIENLSALREVALRQVAEEIGAKRVTSAEPTYSRDETIAAEAPQAVSERLLALVEPYPGAQRLVRRAWRSAQRLGGELDLLWVRPPSRRSSEEEQRSLTALRQLASLLGARLLVEESDDVAGRSPTSRGGSARPTS
jgi:two-component system, OmpR family, sensor histidine kinase KdpD